MVYPMKTHFSLYDALLWGGLGSIQPSWRMRVAPVFRHARGGHSGACLAVKAVPRCNQCAVTFERATLWSQHTTVGFVVQSVRTAYIFTASNNLCHKYAAGRTFVV